MPSVQADAGKRNSGVFSLTADELAAAVEHRDAQWVAQHGGADGIARALRSSVSEGLSIAESPSDPAGVAGDLPALRERVSAYGPNSFKYPPPKSFLRLLLEAFNDTTIIVLCAAAVVSLGIGLAVAEKRSHFGYLEGAAIVLVVCVVVLVQAVIDRQKESKFRQLNSVKDNYEVQIVRAGFTSSKSADQVLVGDLLKVAAGDKLPADGILVEGSAVKTNESAMTGEPIDIAKDVGGDEFMLSGTTVSEGVGHVLILAVGERSQWGIILKGLIVEPENTPLQERLDRLAWSIGKLGILFASLTFAVSLIRWIVDSKQANDWDGTLVLDFFIDAITIVVVAIPEGLPLAITLGLAFAMRKMMKDSNLVRRLEACETMGSATQLNADKTGTLTQNRMTVVEATWADQHVVYEGAEDAKVADAAVSDAFRKLVAANVSVNSQANLEFREGGHIDHLGSKTECALLQLVHRWGMDYKLLRKQNKAERVYMFDSNKKSMSTSQRLRSGVVRLHTKGAPEMVLKSCSSKLASDGMTVEPMNQSSRTAVLASVEAMARRGLRTLLMAYRDVDHEAEDQDFWADPPDSELTYLGVVGIKDPIRPETKEAVRQLKEAGVSVRMVTGDNLLTATYIAREAGILDDDGVVMEGPEFRKLSEEELEKVALRIQVLARSTPNDKLKLVRVHKKLGEVTSVTGDGTNDGPALKEADVGFALGIAGTEIAKEACDIVILDDNIQSMTKAVLWGRNVYESIRKFLQFQLVVNVVAVSLNFISACAGMPLPLGAVPLLWVNMIMDSMGALALATEPPRPDLLKRKPYGRRAPLINRAMYRNIIGLSIYQLIVCLILQFKGSSIFGLGECLNEDCRELELEINSIIFNVFVFMQIGSEINSRRIVEKNVFAAIQKSMLFIIIVVLTVLIQLAVMFGVGGTNVGNSIGIGKINGAAWGASILLGALVLPWGFLVRCIPLDWCYGPTDDDPTEMSKLEKLLHFPKRKPFRKLEDEELEAVTVDGQELMPTSSSGGIAKADSSHKSQIHGSSKPVDVTAAKATPPKVRLRVFVHAVAFVNVISRGHLSGSSSANGSANGSSEEVFGP